MKLNLILALLCIKLAELPSRGATAGNQKVTEG